MLDGLLGRGFSSKCKSLIKHTKERIEGIRKRAEAKHRFLKDDLAKLLANGLDINAYGRTEEYLAGLSLLSCYDFIEHACDYIWKQLSIMQKQRECPEECREAVASLMFAAARFSDLPDLRELRDAFQERYGNSLEYFANKVFVEKLASKPSTAEKRLQLLQAIASEFSIKWDSRGFEQRMAKSPSHVQDQPSKYGPPPVSDDKDKLPIAKETVRKTHKHDVTAKERQGFVNDGRTIQNGMGGDVLRREGLDNRFLGRQGTTGREEQEPNGHKQQLFGRKETLLKADNNDHSFRGRREFTAQKHGPLNEKEVTVPNPKTGKSGSSSRGKRPECDDDRYTMDRDRVDSAPEEKGQFRRKSEAAASCARLPVYSDGKAVSPAVKDHSIQQSSVHATTRLQEEEADRLKSYLPPPYVKSKDNVIPPPYVKPKGDNHGGLTASKHADIMDPSPHKGANTMLNSDKIQKDPDHSHHEEQSFGPGRANGHGHTKDHHFQNDIPLPKPRSMRRKHSKSSSSHDDIGNFEDVGNVKRSSSSRRKDHSRKGLQILFDDEHYQKDEEERMMDKLLLHYSKKSSNYDIRKLKKKSQAHPSDQMVIDAGESPHNRIQDVPDVKLEMVALHTRSTSLPQEQSTASEATKVFARANSFQPDNQARHVHPKLPDYDDLAARFSALKGR
ncbi:hypothetical protein RJ640_024290 [Escallonia rubra]|uniref:Regulator of Vps4 activity in the MVB pathway protein n=1 Tax=Escallonia rubra TaxID=112253 RepID=A0AA88R9J4_9ASTE|nr:hypothetical protein RJ640_024290 [Escallonia rubra]